LELGLDEIRSGENSAPEVSGAQIGPKEKGKAQVSITQVNAGQILSLEISSS
jgi:hypothetical protein